MDQPPPDGRTVRPDVPEEVAVILKRALVIDPAGRYMSAGQMADALGAVLEVLPAT